MVAEVTREGVPSSRMLMAKEESTRLYMTSPDISIYKQSMRLVIICLHLKHWPHLILSLSSHLFHLLWSSFFLHISSQVWKQVKTGTLMWFDPYLHMEWLRIVPIQFAFHANLSMLAIHYRYTGPSRTDCWMLQICDYVTVKSTGYENQACVVFHSLLKRIVTPFFLDLLWNDIMHQIFNDKNL